MSLRRHYLSIRGTLDWGEGGRLVNWENGNADNIIKLNKQVQNYDIHMEFNENRSSRNWTIALVNINSASSLS